MDDIYGLIFDVDGVIGDTEAINARATIRVFDELFSLSNVKQSDFEDGIGKGAEAYILAAARIHNIEINDEQLAGAVKLREKHIVELFIKEPRTFEGVLELINTALESNIFKTAIATSSSRELSQEILKAAAVPYQRMVYITGDMVKNKKPDPEIYLTTARKLKIEPAKCAVIEDAPSGIQAAKSAGCKCIAVTNTIAADKLSQADIIIDSLKQINLKKIITIINK